MAKREAIAKGVRFEVFKRDGFCCVYCGAHPPAVILHIDHIHPVAEGGTNDLDNLITACAPCNLGKGARLLSSAPKSLSDRAAEVAEREEQIAGYREVMERARQRIESDIDQVASVFEAMWGTDKDGAGFTLSDSARMSVRRFLERLDLLEVYEAAQIACTRGRARKGTEFRYFCGICWSKIRELDE